MKAITTTMAAVAAIPVAVAIPAAAKDSFLS
jgi:hypothetical protein